MSEIIYDENQYINNLKLIKENGADKSDRTNTGTLSVFRPPTMRFKIDNGKNMPLLTTKFTNFNAILKELLWIISGSTNINDLDSKIWNQWAITEKDISINNNTWNDFEIIQHGLVSGSIGKMYGYVLRNDEIGGDPLQELIDNLKNNPSSRRHVLTTWHNEYLPNESISPQENVLNGKGALANCHGTVLQFYVNNGKLSLSHYQRSGDMPLGIPFNIMSYATFLLMIAKLTGLEADELIFDIGDAHIYNDQVNGVETQLSREILNGFPSLEINMENISNIDDFKFDDFELKNYNHQPSIKFPIAI